MYCLFIYLFIYLFLDLVIFAVNSNWFPMQHDQMVFLAEAHSELQTTFSYKRKLISFQWQRDFDLVSTKSTQSALNVYCLLYTRHCYCV
jgi:hypothetical protein